jgi:hypothetical protein
MQPQSSIPRDIQLFEKLNLAAVAIGIIVAALIFDANRALTNTAFVLLVQGFVLIVLLFLIFWISRWRSNIGRWIWTIRFVVGLVFSLSAFASWSEYGWLQFLSVIQWVLEGIGIYLLFTPAARQWFHPNDKPQRASSSQAQ